LKGGAWIWVGNIFEKRYSHNQIFNTLPRLLEVFIGFEKNGGEMWGCGKE
jgi:hypothetical protein